MTNKRIIATAAVLSAAVTAIAIIMLWPSTAVSVQPAPEPPKKSAAQLDLEHRQEIWISALEWCESRGRNTALNPEDLDGTPSYSNFQWKPSTLLNFGKEYGLIATSTTLADVPELLKNYELQRDVVRGMVKHLSDAELANRQFPGCIRKIGLPPRK